MERAGGVVGEVIDVAHRDSVRSRTNIKTKAHVCLLLESVVTGMRL